MGIYKTPKTPYWQYDFTIKGCRYRGSTGFEKRSDAETFYANERRKFLLGIEHENRLTLFDAFYRYEKEHAMFLTSYPSVQAHVNHLLSYFGESTPLDTIDQAEMKKYTAHCRTEIFRNKVYSYNKNSMVTAGKGRVASNATINRRISTFQGMHTLATKQWKVKTAPINFEEIKFKEKTPLDNTLSKQDADKLLKFAPEHLRHFITISLHTGLRKMNVLSMRGKQIDITSGIIRTIGKGGKPIHKIISDGLLEYILEHDLHNADYVCAVKGKPVKQIKTAWNTAFRKAELKRVRIHDLRHTFGTWLYEQTGDQRFVQEMLDHSDIKTSIRYTHTKQKLQREKLNAAMGKK